MNDEGEEDLELVAKMDELYSKLGISVYDANGELKNTFGLLEALAEVYPTLTNAEKAYVTETIAGKYQAQNAAAILNNFQTAIDATATAFDSAGSAASENEKVIDSIQGKISAFQSAFEELSSSLVDSDLIKGLLSIGTFLVSALGSFDGFIVKMASALVVMTSFSKAVQLLRDKFSLLSNGIDKNTASIIKNVLASAKLSGQTKSSIMQILSEKGAVDLNTKSLTKGTKEKLLNVLATTNLTKAQKKAVLATIEQNVANSALTKSNLTLRNSFTKLWGAIKAHPIMTAFVAVSAITTGLQYLADTAERSKDAYQEAQTEYNNAQQEVDSINEKLTTTNDRIAELKRKGTLTFVEQEELNDLEEANRKLQVQLELYEKIAEAKQKEAQNAANKAYNTDYNGIWDYAELTDDGQIKEMGWSDYINPLNFFSNYGKDSDIIIEATNRYADLKDQVSLTNDEIEEMDNLQNSLLTQLSELEEIIPTLSGEAKEEAQSLRDYIVRFVTPELYQQEKVNTFFFDDKDQFKDVQKELEDLYLAGELTTKKIADIRKENADLDSYMRSNYLDNSSIITYYDEIYKAAEQSSEAEVDAYQKAAEARENAGNMFSWDETFLGYLSGDMTTNADVVLEVYDRLKSLADAGELSADKIRELNEEFGFLSVGKDEIEDIVGILQYFNQEAQNTLSNYSATIDDIIEQYNTLTQAVDEYNEAGYLTEETINKIIAGDLLGYLSFENGQLVANTEAFYQSAEAERIAASQKLYDAMAADILAVANGDVENASNLAKDAVAALGDNADIAGTQAQNAVQKFITFAEAVDLANKALEGEELTSDVQDKISAIQNAYKPYFDLLSKPIEINRKKYTSGSSSSSSSSSSSGKEWWEEELDKLKQQFDYSEITIEEYINGLDNLLGRVEQGSDAWREINDLMQEQKLDKVENDFDQGIISLDEYIDRLKELIKVYKQGTQAWDELADKIKDALQDKLDQQKDDLETAEDAAIGIIDDEIKKLEDIRDAEEERYDKLIEEKKEANEETERELELAQLQEALENAKKEKTKRVKCMLSIKMAQNGETPEEDNTVGKICFEI